MFYKNKTETNETNVVVDRENAYLAQDDLYILYVVRSTEHANRLKLLNLNQGIVADDIKVDEYSVEVYQYASEIPIFNMRNNPIKEYHNVVEHNIVLSYYDISPNPLVQNLLGYAFDLDAIIVNQFMFTFIRQPGYLARNDT